MRFQNLESQVLLTRLKLASNLSTAKPLVSVFNSSGQLCREDRRKGEDRRNDLHRKSVVNGREAGDDARMQMRRRDGSEEREADVMRNDSLVKERSHHGCGELKRDKDNVRSGSHHDSESRRDKDGYHLSYQQDKVWLVSRTVFSAKMGSIQMWCNSLVVFSILYIFLLSLVGVHVLNFSLEYVFRSMVQRLFNMGTVVLRYRKDHRQSVEG